MMGLFAAILAESFEGLITIALFALGWHLFRNARRCVDQHQASLQERVAGRARTVFQTKDEKGEAAGEEAAPSAFVPGLAHDLREEDSHLGRSDEDEDDWPDIWTFSASEVFMHDTDDGSSQQSPCRLPESLTWQCGCEDGGVIGETRGACGPPGAGTTTWASHSSPQAAVEADVSSALEAALASGDAALADSVLATGARLCRAGWLTKACGQMRSAGVALLSERAVDFAHIFAQAGRADLAVDLWLERCMDGGRRPADIPLSQSLPEAELYAAVLAACAHCGDFEAAARAARNASWRAPPAQGSGFPALLALTRWLARRRAIGPALACYDSARRSLSAVVTDLATHRAVLKACVSSNDMMRADMLFQDLIDSPIAPDFATFAAMIRGHRAASHPEDAMSYFELMKKHGLQPDASLFDVVLDGCLWKDVPALVERVLADMESARVKPSSGTLATILKLYGQSCKIQKALEVFEDLPRRHGLQVESRAFNAMIMACLQNGRLDLALDTFDRMCAEGCRAKARTYEALLTSCLRRGNLDQAVRLLDDALGLCLPVPAASDQVHEDPADGEGQGMSPPRPPQARPRLPRIRLEAGILEAVLDLIGRRGEAARLGVPLVARLRGAGCQVPEALAASLTREAEASARAATSTLHQRRDIHNRWRNFRRSSGTYWCPPYESNGPAD